MKLQEYLDQKYPTKEDKEKVKEIDVKEINKKEKGFPFDSFLDGQEIDFSEFSNLERIFINGSALLTPLTKLGIDGLSKLTQLKCSGNKLNNLDVRNLSNLKVFNCFDNNFTSVDFLKVLPNPKKMEELIIYNNNIQPTSISVFSRFVNLKILKVGTMK